MQLQLFSADKWLKSRMHFKLSVPGEDGWEITQGTWIWIFLPLDGNCEPVQVMVWFLLLISLYKPERIWEVQYLPSGTEKKSEEALDCCWRLNCCSTLIDWCMVYTWKSIIKKLFLILKFPLGKHACVFYGLPLVLWTTCLNVQCFSVVVATKKKKKKLWEFCGGRTRNFGFSRCSYLVFAKSEKIPGSSGLKHLCLKYVSCTEQISS